MKIGSKLVGALVVLLLATAAQADATTASGAHKSYGTAGCGLGSLVFGDQPGIIQIVAATLNGIGGQTFAITSGTSNCGEAAVSVLTERRMTWKVNGFRWVWTTSAAVSVIFRRRPVSARPTV